MSKYHAKKVKTADGTFDSQREYQRWCELKLLQRAGKITELQRQVRFELLPSRGRERAVHYIADFTYRRDGELVVEDAKGVRTDAYVLKRKMMLHLKGISIQEV